MLSKFKNAINSNIPKMKVYSKNMLSKFKNVTDSSILKMRVYSKSALNTFKDTTTSCVSKMMIFSKDMLSTLCEADDATAVGSNTVPEKENDVGGKPQIERTAMTAITTARHKYSIQGKLPRQYLLLIQNNSWTLIYQYTIGTIVHFTCYTFPQSVKMTNSNIYQYTIGIMLYIPLCTFLQSMKMGKSVEKANSNS